MHSFAVDRDVGEAGQAGHLEKLGKLEKPGRGNGAANDFFQPAGLMNPVPQVLLMYKVRMRGRCSKLHARNEYILSNWNHHINCPRMLR